MLIVLKNTANGTFNASRQYNRKNTTGVNIIPAATQ
jgi:hypothetical protein